MTHIKESQLVTASYCSELYKLNGNYIELSYIQQTIVNAIKYIYEATNDLKNFNRLDKIIGSSIFKALTEDSIKYNSYTDYEHRTFTAYCSNMIYQFFKVYPPSDWVLVLRDSIYHEYYNKTAFVFSTDIILRKRNDSRLFFHAIDFIKDITLTPELDIYKHKRNLVSKILWRAFNNFKLSYFVFSFRDFNYTNNMNLPQIEKAEVTINKEIKLGAYYQHLLNADNIPKRIICLDRRCPKRKECMKDV